MLFFVCVDQGCLVCECEEILLVGEIVIMVDFFEVIFDEVGVGIEVCGEVCVLVECVLFQWVVINLLYNVVQYIVVGGMLWVGVEWCGDEVWVVVSNFGVLIVDEYCRYLFECFYWVDVVCSNSEVNYGFGLFIVKVVVSMYGGLVFVDSVDGWNIFGFIVLSFEWCWFGDCLLLGEGDLVLF